MSMYRITGKAFHFDALSDLMEYVMQQNDSFISSLNCRLIVKKQDGATIVLYSIVINPENKEIRLVRARRS